MKNNYVPSLIINDLPAELLLKIFSYLTIKNFKNLSLTCQRFNDLCTVNFSLRINFDNITNGEFPIINRNYSKVIMEGNEIPENLLDKLSSLNLQTVKSLKITRADHKLARKGHVKRRKHCRIHAQTYLKILKMFSNIKVLELDTLRILVILKSDVINENDLPDLQNLTDLKVHNVNESIYQCLWKATNLSKIVSNYVTEATRVCRNFMSLLQQCRSNLKHLEADTFDYNYPRFSMDALEHFCFDSPRYDRQCGIENKIPFSLIGSPILKTCKIKIHESQLSQILLNYPIIQPTLLTFTVEFHNSLTINESLLDLKQILVKLPSLEQMVLGKKVVWEK